MSVLEKEVLQERAHAECGHEVTEPCYVVIGTADNNSPEWHELRKKGIGGSDVAKIAGISKWESPIGVWMSKTGRKPVNENVSPFAEWGHRLENVVAEKFKEETGLPTINTNKVFRSIQFPFMIANLDRLIVDEHGDNISFLEVKTAHEYTKDKWDVGKIPDDYMLQVQHYMAVMGFEYCYVAVLIGGNDYRHYKILRDYAMIGNIISIEEGFWALVKDDTPPEPTFADDTETVKSLFADRSFEENEFLPAEADELAEKYKEMGEQIKELEVAQKECKNRLVAMLGKKDEAKSEKFKVSFKYSNYFNEDIVRDKYPDIYNENQTTVFDKDNFKKTNKELYTECSEPRNPRFSVTELKKGA